MKFKATALLVICTIVFSFAQEVNQEGFTITEQTIKKDENGKIISHEKFTELMATGQYTIVPEKKDGKIVSVTLQKATAEQLELIKKLMEQQTQKFTPIPAPDFDVTDIKGNRYKLSDLANKTVVLNFWFTSCAPCIAEMPVLNELVKENKEVVFIALAKDTRERIDKFLTKRQFDYNIVADAKAQVEKYNVTGFPMHFIIKNGIITHRFLGATAQLKQELQDAINGTDQQAATSKESEQIMLGPNSDIRDEKGNKLGMMETVEKVNSQQYILQNATDDKGNKYILVKKK